MTYGVGGVKITLKASFAANILNSCRCYDQSQLTVLAATDHFLRCLNLGPKVRRSLRQRINYRDQRIVLLLSSCDKLPSLIQVLEYINHAQGLLCSELAAI